LKTLPSGLQAHLASGATTLAWCWRLTRADGERLGFTDHDRDLAFDATQFEAGSGFTGTEIKQSLGLAADNLDASGALTSGRLSEADLAGGLFDDARVEIWRVNWEVLDERVLVMAGSVGEVKRAEGAFTAELRSLAHYLNQEQERIYQFACDATLGDARCTVDLTSAAFRGSGTVTGAESFYLFRAAGLDAYAAGWFAGGLLTWTGGANNGRAMEVKRHDTGSGEAEIELWRSMASAIAPGDAFTVTAGCDKTFPTCKAKFANGVNFRGFPHIPGNSFVIAVPGPGDPSNDGRSMQT
jgi:uncharacterized phage protein (TIGR02218 family)